MKKSSKEEHKVKEFLGSSSKDYQGLIRKTSGDLRLVKAPDINIIKLAKAIKGNNEKIRVLDLSFNKNRRQRNARVSFCLRRQQNS